MLPNLSGASLKVGTTVPPGTNDATFCGCKIGTLVELDK